MRQIVLDTETTGLIPQEGHRIIEIGCIELIDRQYTGNNFHHYINPKREVEPGALAVHGITNDFLATKPVFAEIVDDFLEFIKGAELIAHNAEFDVGFINYELSLLSIKKRVRDFAKVFDTLSHARKMFPGQRNNLDALCKRLKVDARERKLHGALLDAHLLAEVYLLMTGGQTNLFTSLEIKPQEDISKVKAIEKSSNTINKLRIISADNDELLNHNKIKENIKKISGKDFWEDHNEQ